MRYTSYLVSYVVNNPTYMDRARKSLLLAIAYSGIPSPAHSYHCLPRWREAWCCCYNKSVSLNTLLATLTYLKIAQCLLTMSDEVTPRIIFISADISTNLSPSSIIYNNHVPASRVARSSTLSPRHLAFRAGRAAEDVSHIELLGERSSVKIVT